MRAFGPPRRTRSTARTASAATARAASPGTAPTGSRSAEATLAYDPLGRLTSSSVAGTLRGYACDGDGLRTYTAPAIPAEVHAARTQTATGVFFNINDLLTLLRKLLSPSQVKGPCGC